MRGIHIDNIEDGFDAVLNLVRQQGETVEARNYRTREITNLTVHMHDPSRNIVWEEDSEEYNILMSEIETVKNGIEPQIQLDELDDKLDLDDGTFYEDVIRERISHDWPEWLRLLDEDPGTRKACSLFGSEPDPPCTSRLQFMIRDDHLHCYSYNRSQDMSFAFPMDVGLFQHIQKELARTLRVELGHHEHTMTSAHLYEDDW